MRLTTERSTFSAANSSNGTPAAATAIIVRNFLESGIKMIWRKQAALRLREISGNSEIRCLPLQPLVFLVFLVFLPRGHDTIWVSVKITISKENYLKTIAEAEGEGEPVIAATVGRWLNVSAPAVTMAIKRLKRDSLIRVGREGQLSLTASGRDIANRLLHRHHLIERMLTEIFGMEWYKVHDEAEQLEHAVSADFQRRLVEKLGTGEACPHGTRVGRHP